MRDVHDNRPMMGVAAVTSGQFRATSALATRPAGEVGYRSVIID